MDTYITLADAQTFIDAYVLDTDAWDCATDDAEREKALRAATRIIDRLRFAGHKASDSQDLQFPRGTDTAIPRDIEEACVYIAIELLDGVDLDIEFSNLQVDKQNFGGAQTSYSRPTVQAHIVAGIPSIKAWRLLKPYLRDPRRITILRKS